MSSSTIKILIIFVIITAVAGGVFGFVGYKALDQGEKLDEQIEAIEAEKVEQSTYDVLKRVEQESIVERERLQTYFLNKEADSILFLSFVEEMAADTGIELKTNKLDKITDPTDGSIWLQVVFLLGGGRDQVISFLELLEVLPYMSRIQSAALRQSTPGLWTAEVEINVQLLTYEE